MKKLLALIAIISAFTFSANAQWTTSGTNIYNSNTGNVGIGTTSPSAKLNISGGGTTTGLSDIGTTLTQKIQTANPPITLGIGYVAADIPIIQSFNDVNHTVTNFSLNPFGGNIGIGTTSALEKLDISGTTSGFPGRIMFGDGGNYAPIMKFYKWSGVGANYFQASIGNSLDVQGGLSFQTGSGGAVIGSDTQNTRMVITRAGNVGIGTTSPDTKLTVNGSIHSTEVNVDLSIPAPDYVFEKSYDLKNLKEVKNYIDLNKHLSEIPSAKEMEQSGINVGEMNMKLLKKVEELTLYLIEQNKRIENLESQIKHK